MPDYIDPVVAVPLGLLLWAIVLTLMFRWHEKLRNRIDDYFAMRRHIRREKARMAYVTRRPRTVKH